MSLTQPTLNFTASRHAPAPLATLVSFLSDNPGWHTARQLAAALELSDRRVRQLAEFSCGLIVSGPGTPGYQHASHCTTEEISHAADTLMSQAKLMIRRAIRIRRNAHRIIA